MIPPAVKEVLEKFELYHGTRPGSYVKVSRSLTDKDGRLARQSWFDVRYVGDTLYAKCNVLLLHYLSIETHS